MMKRSQALIHIRSLNFKFFIELIANMSEIKNHDKILIDNI